MLTIESKKATIHKSNIDVFDFLAIPGNYSILMPSKVRSFTFDDNSADLDIEGIGAIKLAFTRVESPTLIEMKPTNKVPFSFDIQWHILALSDTQTEVKAIINADLNFMMRMMAEKLLADFIDVQVHKLEKHLNSI